MSTIDLIALAIKGAILGGLGGVLLPTLWMSIVFSGADFLAQFTNGTNVLVIATSVIAIPFTILFQGLIGGGLRDTFVVGAVSGMVVALLIAILTKFTSKRNAALVITVLGVIAALVLVLTQSNEITLALGLEGLQIWVLGLLYVLLIAWLSQSLRNFGGVA